MPSSLPQSTAPKLGGDRRELGLRILSALVMAPVAVGLAYLGGWPFIALWAILAAVVFWEWAGLVAPSHRTRLVTAAVAAIAAGAVITALDRPEAGLIVTACGLLPVAVLAPFGRRLWCAGGLLYAAAVLFAPAILRRDADFGLAAILFLFAVVWTTDILAYFAGRAIGGPRLWPAISPKKTWSGAVGGLTGAVLAGTGVALAAGLHVTAMLVLLCTLLSVAAQGGDLLESFVKRRFEAKDASHVIPGHGGVMDRLDGFLMAATIGALIGVARVGFAAPARGLLVW